MSEKKAEAAPAGEGGEKKGGKGKLFLILGVVLLLAAGGGAYVFLLRPPAIDADADASTEGGGEHGGEHGGGGTKAGGHGAKAPAEMGAMEALDSFIANLADEDGRRYLKATIQLEFYESSTPPELGGHMAQVRDLILTLFTSKTFADIRTPEGKGLLREEIINRINRVLRKDVVKAVYFTEFIVQ